MPRGGPLFISHGGSYCGNMYPHSRELLNIIIFFSLFITDPRVLHENIFLLPYEEYSRRLHCILSTFNMFDNYRGTL